MIVKRLFANTNVNYFEFFSFYYYLQTNSQSYTLIGGCWLTVSHDWSKLTWFDLIEFDLRFRPFKINSMIKKVKVRERERCMCFVLQSKAWLVLILCFVNQKKKTDHIWVESIESIEFELIEMITLNKVILKEVKQQWVQTETTKEWAKWWKQMMELNCIRLNNNYNKSSTVMNCLWLNKHRPAIVHCFPD